MVDPKKTEDENKEEESSTTDAGKGSESESAKEAAATNAAAKRMEEANKDRKEILDREEALRAKKGLGGGSEAGQAKVEETEDEKWAKDAKERYEGTGMDPTPDEEDGKAK